MKPLYTINIHFSNKNRDPLNSELISADLIEYTNTEKLWLFSSNNYAVKKSDYKNLGFGNLINNNLISVQDKKLYRYPKLDLPRQKVDLIKDKFNCSVIRDPEKADIYIISLNTLNSFISTHWGPSMPFSEAFKTLKFLKEENMLDASGLEKIKTLINDVPHNSMIKFNLGYIPHNPFTISTSDYITYSKITILLEKTRNKIDDFINNLNFTSNTRDFVLEKTYQKNYNALLNTTAQVVLDTDICNIIDKDLAVLDNNQYNNIKSMVTSQDIDNRTLALEMLANCNIDKSFDLVSSIYYWNWDWIKSTNNWNTVNVKTFRKRMKAYEGGHGTTTIYSFNNYINLLIADNKLTKYAIDFTRELLYKTLLSSSIGDSAGVFNISLDNLDIKNELKEKILLNE
tara:strand:- start:2452 stop:3651 length:1200 start_codon:yes stop_codon:yes gene_type:complete